jgi:hypothetical protein
MMTGGVMRKLRLAGVCSALLIAGCMSVPPLDVDSIAIGDIVQRVKCEIAFAVPDPQPPHPTGPYQWMKNWSAKVDLTLITNARSAVTPSASFIDPISKGTFTFGISAGLETQAERTELLSFSLSLAEMREFRKRAECNLPNGRGLYGNLGLREWIDSALGPVEAGLLKVGRHPRLGGKPVPAPEVKPVELRGDDPLEPLRLARTAVVHYAKVAVEAYDKAYKSGIRDKVQETYDEAGLVYGAWKKADPERRKADRLAKQLAIDFPPLQADITKLHTEAKDAGKEIDSAKDGVDAVIKRLPLDPPIDSLSHSVKFVVAVSGSLSPNWVLVHFRGPSANSNLLSGTHTRTHTLSIVLGSPDEQTRALNNLVILQNLRP